MYIQLTNIFNDFLVIDGLRETGYHENSKHEHRREQDKGEVVVHWKTKGHSSFRQTQGEDSTTHNWSNEPRF